MLVRAPLPSVGRAASVCGPSRGGVRCAGVRPAAWTAVLLFVWPPSWWGMLCWCPSAAGVVHGVVMLGLGCCGVCRLAPGVVGLGLVVLVVVF